MKIKDLSSTVRSFLYLFWNHWIRMENSSFTIF